jgi:uncharacterized integral membrane protein
MKNMKLILSLVLVAVIVVFSIQNAEELQVRFLFWSLTTRRVFILFGVLTIGVILGWLWRAHVDSQRQEKIRPPHSDEE